MWGRRWRVPPRPLRDVGPSLASAAELELLDGDEVWATAQQTLAKASSEREALHALVTVVNLQRRRGDYPAGLAGARAPKAITCPSETSGIITTAAV